MPSRRGRAATRKRRGESVKARAPSAAQFERILANLDEITYEVATPGDPMAGTIVFVSRQVEELIGHRPEEFKRDPTLWFQLVHRDDVPSVVETTRTMYESRRPVSRLYRLKRHPAGEYRWIEDRAVPRLGAGGRVVGYYGAARDVTERISADEQLRFQADILRNVRDSVIVTDLDGRITYWNEGATALFGYRAEEMLGKTPTVLHPDEDLSALRADLERVLHGTDYLGERLGRRKDGTAVRVDVKTTLLRGRDGRPAGFLGVSEDITERRRAETALQQSEDQYRDLVEHSQDLICIHDLDGLILSINPWAARMLGYGPAEMLGMSVRDVLAPEVRHEFDQYIAAIRAEGAAQGLMLMQTRTGEKRIWEYRNTLRTEGVAAPVVRGMARDITERRRAEQALRVGEERYRTLFETATDAVYITTRSGQLLDVNEAAAELWGGPREELLRLNASELYADPRDRERFVEEVERQGVVRNLEIRSRRRDGSVRDCLVSGSARRAADGTVVGYQGVAHDITGRKRAEDMVRASRDRLRALAVELHNVREEERTAVAREIHDEFGQALTGLKMDLTWLTDRCASGPADAQERLGAMLELVDRSVDAVRRLAAHLRPAVLDDLGIAAAVEWLSEDFAKHSGIECGCEVPSAEPPLGPDRATAVFRIAQEALTNVARHSGARHVEIAFTATDEGIGLEVRDDGKGITEDQVSSVRSIGLVGMRERAGSLGGRVYVRPGVDRGTIVTLEMPFAGPGLPAAGP